MSMAEGGGTTEEMYADIVTNTDSLDGSIVFHVVKDITGFVLYMHQQIPSILQDMSLEFEMKQSELIELEENLTHTEVKAQLRRKLMSEKREIKHDVKKLEKLMSTVSNLQKALQLMISEIPNIKTVLLILGGSPLRASVVYELSFSHGGQIHSYQGDFAKTKAAEGLSRKAIRALISKDAGSRSYPGPMKLFLMVYAPSSFNLPQHFLPKRDFRPNRKIVPLRLRFKCRAQATVPHPPDQALPSNINSSSRDNSSPNDFIWFQCRHVIKGMVFQPPSEEQ